MRVPGERDPERGKRIEQLRETEGLTRSELAKLVGVSDRSVFAWEREGTPMATPSLTALAAVLRTTTDFIRHGTLNLPTISPAERRPRRSAQDDNETAQRLTAMEARLANLEQQMSAIAAALETLVRTTADHDPSPSEQEARQQRRSSKPASPPTDATPNPPADD